MGRLDNRIALVTGSARGLGEGIARALSREGAVVVCADVLDAGPVADSLGPSPDGRKRKAVALDVTDRAQAAAGGDRSGRRNGKPGRAPEDRGLGPPTRTAAEHRD